LSDYAISVEGLSKEYVIGGVEQSYRTVREAIVSSLIAPFGRLRKLAGKPSEDERFLALKDINFEVKPGEVVGIVGRNGAGKSTLLKILSRITEPTKGRVRIKGRVGSLLEVGTGFHPELTGRENIFLNGTILGMTRADIRKRFDEIVAFAEISEFLDTPVKRYSSGMYVRLAFAVAAHLEPDILIVDEVLAVGDVEFQKKCLNKMDETSMGGRTVLFVTHDMRKATALCRRGLLLNSGVIESDGVMSQVADRYMMQHENLTGHVDLTDRRDRTGEGYAQFQSISLLKNNEICRTFAFGSPFTQQFSVKVHKRAGEVVIYSAVTTLEGMFIFQLVSVDEGFRWVADAGEYKFTVTVDKLLLLPGTYYVDLWIGDRNFRRVDYVPKAISFTVIQDADSSVDRVLDNSDALMFQRSRWQLN
jgi:lipopolysaccharide transport system ATP-binding protein